MLQISNDYCVIGLGKFGTSVIDTLLKLSKGVLAIDLNPDLVDKISERVDYAVALDSTDIEALEGVGIRKFQNVIVCISDLEASIMTCAILKELKIPNITAKAITERHQKVLESIGITNIVRPEVEAAKRTALRSVYRLALDLVDVDEKHSIVKALIHNKEVCGVALKNLDVRGKFNVNIVAIQRGNKLIVPTADDKLEMDDILLFISDNLTIKKFYDYVSGEISDEEYVEIQKDLKQKERSGLIKLKKEVNRVSGTREISLDTIKEISNEKKKK